MPLVAFKTTPTISAHPVAFIEATTSDLSMLDFMLKLWDIQFFCYSASSMRSGRTRSSRLDATTREIRLSRAVDETEWDLTDFDEDITIGVPNPAHDSMHMLTITLSTIMLMAADEKIPDLHLQWTEKYLECIRDEFGRHPPNVQGILNYIKMITGQQVERIESETKRNPSPSSSVSSRKTNDSKQFAVRTTTTVKPKRNSTSSEPGDTS